MGDPLPGHGVAAVNGGRPTAMWHSCSVSDTYHVRVGPKGRLVIPAPVRAELGLEEGTELTVFVEHGAVVLTTHTALEAQIHALTSGAGGDVVDELITERRREAQRESGAEGRDR